MNKYQGQTPVLIAVDCIIFGYDGQDLKILLIRRGFEPEKNKWSLMGGFIQTDEDLNQAANRVLKQLTGLEDVYLEQLQALGDPKRDPFERTISVIYFSLIDINLYKKQINEEFHPEWFHIKDIPELIFDHQQMIDLAKKKLRYKAALHPILFELLPEKFTLPQLQSLYEGVYDIQFDKRNFSRKVLSSGLLIKLNEKEKESSRKGAFYFQLDKTNYKNKFHDFINFIPNPESLAS